MATFPILSDPSLGSIVDYGVKSPLAPIAIPAAFVIDRDGIIYWKEIGNTSHRASIDTILEKLAELSQPSNTPPVISGTIPDRRVNAGESLVIELSEYASDEQDAVGSLQWEVESTETDIFRAVINRHQLTIQALEGAYGSARITLRLIDSEGETDSQSFRVRVIPAPNTQIELNLTVPGGLSMFHLPLRVNRVNGASQTILQISNLYDVLGGSANVHWLVTTTAPAPEQPNEFKPFFEGANDSMIDAETGFIASVKRPVQLNLVGNLLDGELRLHPGPNIIGIPHYDSGVRRLSHLALLEGVRSNATLIAIYADDGFQTYLPNDLLLGYVPDREIHAGQAVLILSEKSAIIGFD